MTFDASRKDMERAKHEYQREMTARGTTGFNWDYFLGLVLMLGSFVASFFAFKALIVWGLHSMAGWLHSLFQ